MSKNLAELPYTELVERVSLIARATSDNDKKRVRGAVNDEYTNQLPKWEDWTFLMAQSSLALIPPYRTGNATVNTQNTSVTFSSDTVLDSTFTGRQIKFSGNSNVYDMTFSNTTAATINPPLSADVNLSSNGYVAFQARYALPQDFSRFPKNGGLQYWAGGKGNLIPEAQGREDWFASYSPSPSVPAKCRIIEFGTGPTLSVEITPSGSKAYVLPYDYVFKLNPMREVTGGFCDISASGTAVTGSAGTTKFTEAQTGWYIRINAFGTGTDSEWWRISAIANDSSLTLQTAFGLSGATTAVFTICPAPPHVPALLHDALMYGAAMTVMADQNDPQYLFMASQKTASIIHGRVLYKSRVYSQEIDTVATEYRYRR